MTKPTLLDRLAESLKEDEGPTAEDIDREVLSAVETIKAQKLSTVAAEDILRAAKESGDPQGEKVYLFDLAPLYGIIGSRSGRVAENLRDECSVVFEKRRRGERDSGTLEGDLFAMRFPRTPEAMGFQLSALIVNQVGKDLFGDRFETMEVKDLLVMANEADVMNEDGKLDPQKAKAAVASGGVPPKLKELPPGAPKWMALHWRAAAQAVLVREQKKQKEEKAQVPQNVRDPEQFIQRRKDRRKRLAPPPGRDRRKSFDRRGRGY